MKYIKDFSNFFNESVSFLNESRIVNLKNETDLLDPKLGKRFNDMKTYLIKTHKIYAPLLQTLDLVECPGNDQVVQTAATDGTRIFYNIKWVNDNCQSWGKLGFLYLHEMLHVYLRHCKKISNRFRKYKNSEHTNLNIAQDVIIDNMVLEIEPNFTVVDIHQDFIQKDFAKITAEDMYTMYTSKKEDLLQKLCKKWHIKREDLEIIRKWKGDDGTGTSDITAGDFGGGDVFGEGEISDKKDLPKVGKPLDKSIEDTIDNDTNDSGKESGSPTLRHIKLEKLKPNMNWDGEMAIFLHQRIREEDAYFSRRKLENTGMIMTYGKEQEYDSHEGGGLFVFLDTSGSITSREFSIFVTEVCDNINKNKLKYIEIVPFSNGIHLDGRIIFEPDGYVDPEDFAKIVLKDLRSTGGNSLSAQIFDYASTRVHEIFDYVNVRGDESKLKIVIFTDGHLFETVTKNKWKNISDENVLWVIYDKTEFRDDMRWFGRYVFYK